MMFEDSTGKPIKVGDRVRFRGKLYTIKEFKPGEGRFGVARVIFNEPQNLMEYADEINVDLVEPDAQSPHRP